MRSMTMTTLSLFLLSASVASAQETQDSFLDPDNWTGLTKYWKVDGDTIIGDTFPDGLKFNTFLCTKKKYGDFEMTFQIQLKGGDGNSGVQVRSEVVDTNMFVVKGPQCDIGQQYWGSLYGEKFGGMMKAAPPEKVKEVLKPADFNEYYIRCEGKRITIKLNGETMVDEEFEKAPDTGIIALQLHSGGPMKVTFKDIKFKDLSK